MTLSGPHAPARSGTTRRAAVLLHGYGADGNDLISLAPVLGQVMPDCAFYAPNAPEPCEMAPFGRQWFSLAHYDPDMMRRDSDTMAPAFTVMEQGAAATAPVLRAFLEQVLGHEKLGWQDLAVIGFSQGTMMALQVCLRLDTPPACVLGYSGAVVGGERLPAEVRGRPPVMLIHGEEDPVVPFAAMGLAEAALRAAGVPVVSHPRPGLAHGIDEEGLLLGARFLIEHLQITPPAA